MEKSAIKRPIAIVEKCIMGAVGLEHLFSFPALNNYQPYIFSNIAQFNESLNTIPFSALIYSLSDSRNDRRYCLEGLKSLAANHSHIQRIVLASDVKEASLINHLSPSHLHGMVLKSESVKTLQEQLGKLLSETRRTNDGIHNHWNLHRGRLLSPTERAILQFMSSGYSIPEIATRLDRNIKTIRAHKFNAMVKLGVHSDMGLLDAADILSHFPMPDRRNPQTFMPYHS
jgi:DNA-binding NarL/FixJ family response regulator